VHVEAYHVADAVREEEGMGARTDSLPRIALHDPQVLQPTREYQASPGMDIQEGHARTEAFHGPREDF